MKMKFAKELPFGKSGARRHPEKIAQEAGTLLERVGDLIERKNPLVGI